MSGSDDVTFRNITAKDMYITSASNISVIGGSYGPDTDYDNGQIRSSCMDSSCAHSHDILIDGVYFHDAIVSPGSGAHVECLQVWHTDAITIRNSKFWNCEHHSVFLSGEGDPVSGVTFENNWAGGVRSGYYSLRVAASGSGEGCSNILYRNNSSTTAISVTCLTATNVRLVGNLAPLTQGQCDSRYTWSYNVWNGAKCSSTDFDGSLGFVDPANGNLHISPSAPAINRADPSNYPSSDIDGQARPQGGAPDAGADEAG
jgi:hypothetical protein